MRDHFLKLALRLIHAIQSLTKEKHTKNDTDTIFEARSINRKRNCHAIYWFWQYIRSNTFHRQSTGSTIFAKLTLYLNHDIKIVTNGFTYRLKHDIQKVTNEFHEMISHLAHDIQWVINTDTTYDTGHSIRNHQGLHILDLSTHYVRQTESIIHQPIYVSFINSQTAFDTPHSVIEKQDSRIVCHYRD